MNIEPRDEDLLAHVGFVRTLARSLVLDESRADDVAQDALVVAIERRPAGLRDPRAWLAAVTRNLVRSRWRSDRRRARREEAGGGPEPARDPAELAARLETTERLVRAVRDLPDDFREVVLLRYFEGRTPAAIAAAKGCPAPTIRGRLSRALALLRKRLDAEHGGDRRAWTAALLPLAGAAAPVAKTAALAVPAKLVAGLALATTLLAAVAVTLVTAPGGTRPATPAPASVAGPVTGTPVAAAIAPAGTYSIRGEVVRDGAPAAAAIEALPLPLDPIERAERAFAANPAVEIVGRAAADADGRFEVGGLPEGLLEVRATAPDGATGGIFVDPGRLDAVVRVELHALPCRVRGRAVHPDGRPFEGAVAAVPVADPTGTRFDPAYVRTDGEGRFVIPDLAEGRHRLVALVPGHSRVFGPVLDLPRAAEVLFVVDDGFEPLRGRVVGRPEGGPVAGAQVFARGNGGGYTVDAAATTDASGRFSVELPPGEGSLHVFAAGFAEARVRLPAEEPVVELFRLGAVTGRVLDSDSGAPVPGVEVYTVPSPGGTRFGTERRRVRSGPDGRFRIERLPPERTGLAAFGGGRVSLSLAAADHPRVAPDEVEIRPGETVNHDLRTIPAAAVRGRVLDPTGKPAAGIRVRVHPLAGHGLPVGLDAVSDAEGAFRFETLVPALPLLLLAEPPDAAPGIAGPIRPAGGETADVEIGLPAPRRLRVRVVDPDDGRPVAGATVRAYAAPANQVRIAPTKRVETDDAGEALLGPLPGVPVKVYASPPGGSRTAVRRVEPKESGPVVIELPAPREPGPRAPEQRDSGFELRLNVVDRTGRAVPRYETQFIERTPGGGGAGNRPFGRPAGREERRFVEIYRPAGADHRPLPLAATLYGPFGDEAEITVVLGPEHAISGRVVTQAGEAVAGVPVSAVPIRDELDDGRPILETVHAEAVTGDDGSFRLGRLGDGRYRIVAEPPPAYALPEPVLVRPDGDEVVVRLAAAWSPTVRVLDADEAPVAGCRLEVPGAKARTDEEGRAVLRGLTPGRRYRVIVYPPSEREDLAPRIEAPLDAETTTIRLARSYSLHVRVRNPDGTPHPGGTVAWGVPGDAGRHGIPADGNGEAVLRGLPEGEIELSVTPAGAAFGGTDARERRVRSDAGTVDVTLPPRETLELLVTNWPEAATGQAWVREEGDERRGIGLVEPGGRVRFEGLRPGVRYEVCLAPEGTALYWHARGLTTGGGPYEATLVPGGTIEGRLVLPADAEGASVSVSFFGAQRRGEVDEDGTFRIVGVPPGAFEVTGAALLDGRWLFGTVRASTQTPVTIELR